MADIEQLVRAAGGFPRQSCGLRERSIARAVAARSHADRESQFGQALAFLGLTFLLALTVWKHAALAGGAPAIIGVQPAVVQWKDRDEQQMDRNASVASNDDRGEWQDVKRTTRRQQQISRLLARCFGS